MLVTHDVVCVFQVCMMTDIDARATAALFRVVAANGT